MKIKNCSVVLASVLAIAAMLAVGPTASADIINFEEFTGPSTFAAAGPMQTLTIPTSIGNVIVTGGVILTGATNLPADETSVYGTAYFGDPTLLNTITLTFPANIINFFLNLYNGQTYPDTFTASDNLGNSTTVTIAPNTSSGVSLISFPAAGDVVTITTADPSWDFFIDNVGFDQPTPTTPEPATLALLGTGLLGLFGWRQRRRA